MKTKKTDKLVFLFDFYGLARACHFPDNLTSCYVCKHCSDIMWDYTNGPYMSCCDLKLDPKRGCKEWEWDGVMTVGDFEKMTKDEKVKFLRDLEKKVNSDDF